MTKSGREVIKIGIGEELKSRVNIVDVIGRNVKLKKSGSRFVGLCPFHSEKTPSFFVNEDTQSYICFGCGVKGDVIDYVQKHDNLSFIESIERLASEYGIELPKESYKPDVKKQKYFEANRIAAAYFFDSIKQPNNPGQNYMLSRGIGADTMKKFGIGFADAEWDSLYNHLMEKGVSEKVALEVGLISQSKGKYYDRYRNRVMFPIINTRKKVVGFGGRVIDSKDNPKYLNSAESIAFKKKDNLYGINITKNDIAAEDMVILVEGYMDAISLYKGGVQNVVASLGTALTPNQGNLIKRYTKNVVIAYDTDSAGQTASLRGIEILKDVGCNVKVLTLDGEKDPDDFIKANGKEAFIEALKETVPFMDYKIEKIKEKYNLDSSDGAVGFLKEAAKTIAELSPVEGDYYIKKLSKDTGIVEGAIRMEAYGDKEEPTVDTSKARSSIKKTKDDEIDLIEKNLIKLILHDASFLKDIKERKDAFKSPEAYRIFDAIDKVSEDDKEIDNEKLEEALDIDDSLILKDINETILISKEPRVQLEECLAQIEIKELEKREKEIIEILGMKKEEDQGTLDLTKELKDILERKKEIKGQVM